MFWKQSRIIGYLFLLGLWPAPATPFDAWWSSSTPKEGYPQSPPAPATFYPPELPREVDPSSDSTSLEVREAAAWKQLEQTVLKKWNAYAQSSQTVWVDYSDRHNALTQVDFEAGDVRIEGLVAISEADVGSAAARLITQTAQALTRQRDGDGKPIMQTMFPTDVMDAIDGARLRPEIDPTPIIGKDGIQRFKVRVVLKMAPDHVKRRSERYRETVAREAKKWGLDPALVMAVMHTESAFNPMARSPAPAFGLMQLVPRFAGREAYRRIHGVDTLPPPAYLYRPDPNIALGVAYLALLDQVYFKGVADPVKRRYLVICAYNWGPTALKKMLRAIPVQTIDAARLFKLLQDRTPLETQRYLKWVETRRAAYTL